MKKVIERKVYNTKTAELLSYDGIIGDNRCTRCDNLYKTEKGNFFIHHETLWQGECNTITPISSDEAVDFFEKSEYTECSFEHAFPDVEIEEA